MNIRINNFQDFTVYYQIETWIEHLINVGIEITFM